MGKKFLKRPSITLRNVFKLQAAKSWQKATFCCYNKTKSLKIHSINLNLFCEMRAYSKLNSSSCNISSVNLTPFFLPELTLFWSIFIPGFQVKHCDLHQVPIILKKMDAFLENYLAFSAIHKKRGTAVLISDSVLIIFQICAQRETLFTPLGSARAWLIGVLFVFR